MGGVPILPPIFLSIFSDTTLGNKKTSGFFLFFSRRFQLVFYFFVLFACSIFYSSSNGFAVAAMFFAAASHVPTHAPNSPLASCQISPAKLRSNFWPSNSNAWT